MAFHPEKMHCMTYMGAVFPFFCTLCFWCSGKFKVERLRGTNQSEVCCRPISPDQNLHTTDQQTPTDWGHSLFLPSSSHVPTSLGSVMPKIAEDDKNANLVVPILS